jgi:hypothetical protein
MNASDDYCELCDLPRSQCIHGRPPPPPPAPATTGSAGPAPRKRPATRARTTTPRAASSVERPARKVTLRWTSPDALKPLILTALHDAGGELEADELFAALETLAEDVLKPEDAERTPEGELRWHFAARKARVALIGEGLMTKSRPGVWELAR